MILEKAGERGVAVGGGRKSRGRIPPSKLNLVTSLSFIPQIWLLLPLFETLRFRCLLSGTWIEDKYSLPGTGL